MTNLLTTSLTAIREQIETWKAELTAIEAELDEIEQRQTAIQTRVQMMTGVPALSPVGVLPGSPPVTVLPDNPVKK